MADRKGKCERRVERGSRRLRKKGKGRLAEKRSDMGPGVKGRREGRFWKEWAELV